MIRLGEANPILQRIADELSDTAPADIRGLSASQLAAELEARGVEPTTDRAQEKQRRKSKRRLERYHRGKRRK